MANIEIECDDFDTFIDSAEFHEIIIKEAMEMFPDLWDDQHIDDKQVKQQKEKKKRKRETKYNYFQHEWMMALSNPDIKIETSRTAITFRRRFRVPFSIFDEWIIPICRDNNVFEINDERKSRIPLEVKIMVSLRILGRSNCADDINELSHVPASSVNFIFKTFVKNFAKHAYPMFVKIPTGERLNRTLECYSQLGFPGCIGCIDGTQVIWFRSPSADTVKNTGKEGDPSLGFLIIVDHSRYIMYCSNWFYGSTNDISKVKNDVHLRECMDNQLQNIEFNIFKSDGKLHKCRGGYFLTDGGMPKCSIFVDPIKNPCSRKQTYWSEWLESVRKDVECAFSAIKTRFRFLWQMIFYHSYDTIQHAFHTACILHNMILIHDGLDISQWNLRRRWKLSVDEDSEEEEEEAKEEEIIREDEAHVLDIEVNEKARNLSSIVVCQGTTVRYRILDYVLRRNHLIDSFHIQYCLGLLTWPRQLKNNQRKKLSLQPNIIDRVNRRTQLELLKHLYIKPSTLYYTTNTGERQVVKDGLFCGLNLHTGDIICRYIGEEIYAHQYIAKEIKKETQFIVHNDRKTKFLDCSKYTLVCKASMANSSQNLYTSTNVKCVQNAKTVYNERDNSFSLQAITNIPINTEILVIRGRKYA